VDGERSGDHKYRPDAPPPLVEPFEELSKRSSFGGRAKPESSLGMMLLWLVNQDYKIGLAGGAICLLRPAKKPASIPAKNGIAIIY
jgi:hypothetical protein